MNLQVKLETNSCNSTEESTNLVLLMTNYFRSNHLFFLNRWRTQK